MAAAQTGIDQLPAGRAADVRNAVNTAFLDGLQVGALVCGYCTECGRGDGDAVACARAFSGEQTQSRTPER